MEAMGSYRDLLQAVEEALSGALPLPESRMRLEQWLTLSKADLEMPLASKPPSAAAKATVMGRQLQLPHLPPQLDEQDVQIALKLSEDYHLNELDCVSLMEAGHQEWNFLGRDPVTVLRLTAGLWLTERRSLLLALKALMRLAVLDDGAPELADMVRPLLIRMLRGGLRTRMLTLIKELGREDAGGVGGPGAEPYVMDARGALVQRRKVMQRERLVLAQTLVLACCLDSPTATEASDMLLLLRDCYSEWRAAEETAKFQVLYMLLFALLVTVMAGLLRAHTEPPGSRTLAGDAAARSAFHEQLMAGSAEGPVGVVRVAWGLFLAGTAAADDARVRACLQSARESDSDALGFLARVVLPSPAFANDDPEVTAICSAYLHKLLSALLALPLGNQQVREMKDAALKARAPAGDAAEAPPQARPFLSLLALIGAVYEREPALGHGADEGAAALWTFVRFAGEGHRAEHTMVAFLDMLAQLATGPSGAASVYELLARGSIRGVSWSTLLDCLQTYDARFQAALAQGQPPPPLLGGDARTLAAYLRVLRKVMDEGHATESLLWFGGPADLEPLFQLLPYGHVPARLKGALRRALVPFARKRYAAALWELLMRYDLPVAASSAITTDPATGQVLPPEADASTELVEVEAPAEEFPATLARLELLNALLEQEAEGAPHVAERYGPYFVFVRDVVLAGHAQRSYAHTEERWQMLAESLQFLYRLLQRSPVVAGGELDSNEPALLLMKDLLAGRVVLRTLASLLRPGADALLEERLSSAPAAGDALEGALLAGLRLLLAALERDQALAAPLRPALQPLDVVLSRDAQLLAQLVEMARFESARALQSTAIRITAILCARVPTLPILLTEAGVAERVVEDYAACLAADMLPEEEPGRRAAEGGDEEEAAEAAEASASGGGGVGALILQLLLQNAALPSPNMTQLLLRLEPGGGGGRQTGAAALRHSYSCLRVMMDALDRREAPLGLQERALELLYRLAVDARTRPMVLPLLHGKQYRFFTRKLVLLTETPLPDRHQRYADLISSLHQRAWLLQLAVLGLHASAAEGDVDTTQELLQMLFGGHQEGGHKSVALACLRMVATHAPDAAVLEGELAQGEGELARQELQVDALLGSPRLVGEGGVYCVSERGERLVHVGALADVLAERLGAAEGGLSAARNAELRAGVQQLLKWVWLRNRAREEETAQMHCATAWMQMVEVALSTRLDVLLEAGWRPVGGAVDGDSGAGATVLQLLYSLLDETLAALTAPECTAQVALPLSQVALAALARIHDRRLWARAGLTEADAAGAGAEEGGPAALLAAPRLPQALCLQAAARLVAALKRPAFAERVRQRLYAALLLLLLHSRGAGGRQLPPAVLRALVVEGRARDGQIQQTDAEHAQLQEAVAALLRREAPALVEASSRDAAVGEQLSQAVALALLEALLAADARGAFAAQLQARGGLLPRCLQELAALPPQVVLLPTAAAGRRLAAALAQLQLLLRVAVAAPGGAGALLHLGALPMLSHCAAIDAAPHDADGGGGAGSAGELASPRERLQQLLLPLLRLLMVLATAPQGRKTEQAAPSGTAAVLHFLHAHEAAMRRILQAPPPEGSPEAVGEGLEILRLLTGVCAKVLPAEAGDSGGLGEQLLALAAGLFSREGVARRAWLQQLRRARAREQHALVRVLERGLAGVRGHLLEYLAACVKLQGLRLPGVADTQARVLGACSRPDLEGVLHLLAAAAAEMRAALEERDAMLAQLRDVSDLPRHDIEEAIKRYQRQGGGGLEDAAEGALGAEGDTDGSLQRRRWAATLALSAAAAPGERHLAVLRRLLERGLALLCLHAEGAEGRRGGGALAAVGGHLAAVLNDVEALEGETPSHESQFLKHAVRLLRSALVTDSPS